MIKPDSQQAMVGAQNWTVDNKLWMQDPARRGIYRRDMTTGQTELFEPFKGTRGGPYSIFSDKENNIWFLNFGGENIGKIDAKSGKITLYPTPTKRSRPRRGRIDDAGPHLVRRIRRRAHRHVRHQDREVPGMGSAGQVLRAL